MNWLNKIERKFRKFAIKDLTIYLVALTGIIFAVNYFSGTNELISKLTLDPTLIMQGEVWRLITYIFIPPSLSPIWIIFALYFFYLLGTGLEAEWGSFKFDFYYLTGVLAITVAAFFLNSGATTSYLNLSLFLAFAYVYPNFEILLFFFLPVKVKYLSYITWLYLLYSFFTVNFNMKVAIIISLANFFLYFYKDIFNKISNKGHVINNKRNFTVVSKSKNIHKCTICGKTELDDPKIEFRYCSKCAGNHEYCSEHLINHDHIKE